MSDPQSLNAYSYANNNPITLSDPSGENPILAGILLSAVALGHAALLYGAQTNNPKIAEMGAAIIGTATLMGGAATAAPGVISSGKTGFTKSINASKNPATSANKTSVSSKGQSMAAPKSVTQNGGPKPAKNWIAPTNKPQAPKIPDDWVSSSSNKGNGTIWRMPNTSGDTNTIRVMKPTEQYPNGYWRQTASDDPKQFIDPSTGRISTNLSETHIPLPEGYWGN